MPSRAKDQAAEEIVNHYTETYDESQRLTDGFGNLERARTEELIRRYLPDDRAVVVDVGGATGIYAFALAALGHDVHLIDIVPKHIEQAKARAQEPDSPSLASMRVGDARSLDVDDNFADVMLMHGPLYHLTDRADRNRALAEAFRVLKPGGTLLAFAITRYAGAIYGITKGLIYADDYREMIRREVESGERSDPPSWAHTFPSAYFHRPDELCEEITAVGLTCKTVLGIMGPAWLVPDINAAWPDYQKREALMEMARMLENEPVLGPRLMAVASKPV
jgi:ubiquinone/menaquinone biosynthesis C-methylase UbiE